VKEGVYNAEEGIDRRTADAGIVRMHKPRPRIKRGP
jgi:hypothetical protein